MNPIIEQWFETLDEANAGDDSEPDIREFIKQVNKEVLKEKGMPSTNFSFWAEEHGLMLVPISRMWWEHGKQGLFPAVRRQPPGHVEEDDDMAVATVEEELPEPRRSNSVQDAFIEGVLEGVAVGNLVLFKTAPAGPMNQSTCGTGYVTKVEGAVVTVRAEMRDFEVDLNARGEIQLRR